MKKTTRILTFILLAVLCLVTLTSCGKYNALRKAFEEEGYEENQTVEGVAADIKKEIEKDEVTVNVHILTNTSATLKPSVMIIEFKATEDLVNAYKDSSTMQGLVKDVQNSEDVKAVYQSLVDAGHAKGNCLCIPLSLVYYKDITDIVKSVK